MSYTPADLIIDNWSSPITIVGSDVIADLDETVNAIVSDDSQSIKNFINNELHKIPAYLRLELELIHADVLVATTVQADRAKDEADKAKVSADLAKGSETASASSESNAQSSANSASGSANDSASSATQSSNSAVLSASNASASAQSATEAHQSATEAQSSSTTAEEWALRAEEAFSLANFRGEWVSTIAYATGESVSLQGTFYFCAVDNINKIPSQNDTEWVPLIISNNYVLTGWNSVDDFHNTITHYNGYWWVSAEPLTNVNNVPVLGSTSWRRIGSYVKEINLGAVAHSAVSGDYIKVDPTAVGADVTITLPASPDDEAMIEIVNLDVVNTNKVIVARGDNNHLIIGELEDGEMSCSMGIKLKYFASVKNWARA